MSLTGSSIEKITDAAGNIIYDISGGTVTIGNIVGNIISSVWERKTGNKFMATAYLSSGTMADNPFPTACLSISGSYTSFSESISNSGNGSLLCNVTGYMFFTLNASEYEQRSIAWELYVYGQEVLNRLAFPTYTFKIDSANFLALEDYELFKNELELGQRIYAAIKDDSVLEPICIGVKFKYGDLKSLELQFSDSYTSNDSEFRLVDLLEKSVSMGKNVELSKYIYASFVDTGASTGIKDFMTSALDTAKNAIMSSTAQAISWDGAGLRLRKWSNDAYTAYAPEQIWMSNNSIVMTDDSWATAKMAIGKFHDANAGDVWGIVAPMLVGTVLAGSSLVIESAKKDGNTAVFRVDGDGCKLYNSDLDIVKTYDGNTTHITLNPEIGIAIGTYPLYTIDQQGGKTLNTNNAKFWADNNGNLHLKGALEGATGSFTGAVTATSLSIGSQTATEFVSEIASSFSESVKEELIDEIDGKTTVFYGGNSAPDDAETGDIWYDTANEKIKRYTGSTWVDITTEALKSALDAAGDAQSTADGKIRTFAQASAPTGMVAKDVGDLWIDTDDDNKLYRWSGTAWVAYRDSHLDYLIDPVDGVTTTYYSATAPTGMDTGDIWYDTTNHKIKRYDGTKWVDITNEALYSALSAAGDAQSTADGKIRTFAQASAPTGMVAKDVGDLWIDTDDDNKLYRWSGTAWVAAQDTHLDTTVAAKPNVYVQSTRPTTYKKGDIWQDSGNNYRQYTATGNTGNVSDWVLTSVGKFVGTALDVNPDTGVITITSSKKMTIASGGTLELAGNNNVTIGSGGTIVLASTVGMTIQSGANITVNSNGTFTIDSGGKFVITSTNFNIDTNGNVSLTGTVTASAGTIGGWTLATNKLSSGSSTGYVALDSNTSDTYAIWAGNATASSAPFSVTRAGAVKATSGTIGGWTLGASKLSSGSGTSYVHMDTSGDYAFLAGSSTEANAPFRVKRDGTVYLTKLKALTGVDAQGNPIEQDVNLTTYPLWKLNYRTVKTLSASVSGSTVTITLGTSGGDLTANFNKPGVGTVRLAGGGSSNFSAEAYNQGDTPGSSTPAASCYGYMFFSSSTYTSATTVNVGTSAGSGTVASLSLSDYWDAAYDTGVTYGQQHTYIKKGTWSGGQLTISRTTASGGSAFLSIFLSLSGSWGSGDSANSYSYTILDGQGSTGYTGTIDATARYNAGYAAGWAAARAKIGVNDYNKITGPAETVDETETLYTITAGNSDISIVNNAPKHYTASGSAYAYINGNWAAQKNFSKTQQFS